MKKYLILYLIVILAFCACENRLPAFRFSNFKDSSVAELVAAIKKNDVKKIREEVLIHKINVNTVDEKYNVSLLSLALANKKKKAFEELLKLGADPNITVGTCETPLVLAIIFDHDCNNLEYIKTLVSYNANITPEYFQYCNYNHVPILDTILFYNGEDEDNCGISILNIFVSKLKNIDLNKFNNPKEYKHNILYYILKTRNIRALKFFIIDKGFKVPKKVYINGVVLRNHKGYESLKNILSNEHYVFKYSKYKENLRLEILKYLDSIQE